MAGIDEAGRGPLAGPVFAASVIIPTQLWDEDWVQEVRDSKEMKPQKRRALAKLIRKHCNYGIAESSVEEIDSMNIVAASDLAMQRSAVRLNRQLARNRLNRTQAVLIDGKRFISVLALPGEAIVGGDGQSFSIAAASILAKVARDACMAELHREYPQYDWRNNQGYPTLSHKSALAEHGASPHHRRTFASVVAYGSIDAPASRDATSSLAENS